MRAPVPTHSLVHSITCCYCFSLFASSSFITSLFRLLAHCLIPELMGNWYSIDSIIGCAEPWWGCILQNESILDRFSLYPKLPVSIHFRESTHLWDYSRLLSTWWRVNRMRLWHRLWPWLQGASLRLEKTLLDPQLPQAHSHRSNT